MSELFDKQMNVQKESQSLKEKLWGSHKLPQAYEKLCNENERNT